MINSQKNARKRHWNWSRGGDTQCVVDCIQILLSQCLPRSIRNILALHEPTRWFASRNISDLSERTKAKIWDHSFSLVFRILSSFLNEQVFSSSYCVIDRLTTLTPSPTFYNLRLTVLWFSRDSLESTNRIHGQVTTVLFSCRWTHRLGVRLFWVQPALHDMSVDPCQITQALHRHSNRDCLFARANKRRRCATPSTWSTIFGRNSADAIR